MLSGSTRVAAPVVVALAAATLGLTACGGGGGPGFVPAPTYTIGGALSGLAAGQQVVLADNGADLLTLSADGAFTFKTPIAAHSAYSVTVATQPAGQTCAVANASASSVMANVTSVAVTCGGLPRFAYAVNNGDNTVSQYSIDAGGELVPMGVATVSTGSSPQSVAVDPSGRYAYVPNLNDNTVSQYSIAAGGALAPMTAATIAAGSGPRAVAIDPAGSYAYVLNSLDRSISQYSIGAGGTLTPLTPAAVATGNQPWGITIDAAGRYAYVGNQQDNTLAQYAIGSDGTLAPLNPPATGSGQAPSGIAVDPAGLYCHRQLTGAAHTCANAAWRAAAAAAQAAPA